MHIEDVKIKKVLVPDFEIAIHSRHSLNRQYLFYCYCILNFSSLHFLYLGCTPLHWAAIRGNLEACTVLVQAGKKEDLIVADNTGLTPAQLAADKNHRQVAFFLVGVAF